MIKPPICRFIFPNFKLWDFYTYWVSQKHPKVKDMVHM